MRVFIYEAKKLLIKQYGAVIMLLVVLAAIVSLPEGMTQTYGFNTSTDRAHYLEMIQPLTGRLTDEKEKIIKDSYEALLLGQSAEDDMLDRFRQGEISGEELTAALEPYQDILDKEDIITAVFDRYQYVIADREQRMLLPTVSVPVMEQDAVNYFFLLAAAFCGAYAIMTEQSGKKDMILKTTTNGQQRTMLSKVAVMMITVILTSAALSAIDLIKLSAQLPAEYWGFSLCSLERYSATEYDISIIGAFIAVQLIKPIGYMLICMLAMLTARFSKNYVAAVFPYAALPITADYLAERDSQAYFLPTGLMKGYGYFFGDVAEPDVTSFEGEVPIMFHGVPSGLFTAIVICSAVAVIIGGIVLAASGKNRLTGRKALGFVLLPVIMLLTSCGAVEKPYTELGGYDKFDGDPDICENSRYLFETETPAEGESGSYDMLYLTDKQTGERERIPFSYFDGQPLIQDMCATEDNLYILTFSHPQSIIRFRLSDMARDTVYQEPYYDSNISKTALGLAYNYVSSQQSANYFIEDIFIADGRLNCLANDKIFALNNFGDLECLIDEAVEEYQYDSRGIYYVNSDRELKAYLFADKSTYPLTDAHINTSSLKSDEDNIYYQSGDEEFAISKSEIGERAG